MTDRRPGTMVLCVDPAWPPGSGAELRNWRTALGASRQGPVTLISVRGDDPAMAEPAADITLRTLSAETPETVYRRPEGGSHIDLTLSDQVRENLAVAFDPTAKALVIEHPGLCRLLPPVRSPGLKLILDLHNVESDLFRQSETLLSRLFRPRRLKAVRKTERDAIRAVDEVWVCSATDAARIERLHGPDLSVRIVPNAIPPSSEAFRELPPAAHREGGPRLLFVGHLSYRPNVKAAEILARRIMPRVARRLDGAHLAIAGRNPHRRVQALAGEQVAIVADPPDLAPLYDDADIAVIPLKAGGGTRIKIIEAMARGIPVVATERAAEGLGLTDGAEIRLAETPREFETAIAALWRDRRAYQAQRRQAHAHVWRLFAPERIEAAILDALAFEPKDEPAP